MDEYKFDGSVYEFLGIIQWSLLARQVYKEHRKDWIDVLKDSTKGKEAANEYGMDYYVLIKELIRLTDELKHTEIYERESFIEELMQIAESRDKKGE